MIFAKNCRKGKISLLRECGDWFVRLGPARTEPAVAGLTGATQAGAATRRGRFARRGAPTRLASVAWDGTRSRRGDGPFPLRHGCRCRSERLPQEPLTPVAGEP